MRSRRSSTFAFIVLMSNFGISTLLSISTLYIDSLFSRIGTITCTAYKMSKAMKHPLSQFLKAYVTIYDRKYALESNQ